MSLTTDRNDPGLHEKGPDGQQEKYLVLSEEERAKGFVRPVYDAYKHVGPPGPKHPLRDLTPDEHRRYYKYGYAKYEEYPAGSVLGRFWTQEDLNRIGNGCGAVTVMGRALAETYARDPHFYGATFCVRCKAHFPVGEDGEFEWYDNFGNLAGRVGT